MNAAEENQVQPTATDPAAAPASANPPEVTNDQASAEARERDEKGRYRNPLQPRIDELTRDKHDARREAEYWRKRAEAATTPKAEAEEPKTKPTPDKFDDYNAYVEALADWKAEEKISAKLSERDNATQAKQREESRATNWQKGLEEAKKHHPDYEEVLSVSQVPIADHVQELLLDAESGPRLAYYLDRHPDIADKLNGLTPTQAARELGRIEATFSAAPTANESSEESPTPAKETATPPPVKAKTTAAPPPVKPAASGASTIRPLDKMSMDEYVETRRKQGASWARR
jgi:hypothetical protein